MIVCFQLFDNCLAPNTLGDGTGCDNMTAVIVRFKTDAESDKFVQVEAAPIVSSKKRPNDEQEEQQPSKKLKEEGSASSSTS